MKITVLDGYTLNPGDLSWKELHELGEVEIYDRTSSSQIIGRSENSEIVLTNKVVLDRKTISALQGLKYIGVLATGVNVVDLNAAKENNITVTNIPAYSTHSVAQLAFGLMLEFTQDLTEHVISTAKGDWSRQEDFSYTTKTTRELAGKTLGIIGYGQIAKQVIRIAQAFEMRVLVLTSHPDHEFEGIEFVSRDELFSSSDIISIHTALRPDNTGIVNRATLGLMKPSSLIINTSRGGLINEKDLADFLTTGRIAGAALDVLSQEPPPADNPLLHAKNCRITPHIAWATQEARKRLLAIAIDNITAFQAGKPVNVVN